VEWTKISVCNWIDCRKMTKEEINNHKLLPKDVDVMISLGAVCNKTGNYEESLKLLNHAAALDKRNTKVYPEKVIALTSLGKYDQALAIYKRIKNEYPRSEEGNEIDKYIGKMEGMIKNKQ